jgi:hypothetical protein
MAKTVAGVMAVLIVALLFAGCSRSGESSVPTSAKSSQTTIRKSPPTSNKSVEDLEDDFKEVCDYASDLEDAVDKLTDELDDAGVDWDRRGFGGIYIPKRPFLSYRGSCLGF